KPDTIFSGAKRKAITPTEAVADKPSLSSAPVKNVKEWSCALCQVCTTNQDGLNVHFQGKKHKCKEAAFREQKDNKNCGIALSPKKQKFIQLVEHDLISRNQFEEGSSGTNDNDPPSLLIDDGTNDMRKNTIHGKQNNVEFKFWCETCKIGTFSEKVMETHKVGKKHVQHLQQLMETQKDKQCQGRLNKFGVKDATN
uniref:U1-type domain-containing protein n=2 Tax=Solanum tuberosum TaxID=4113 RepID=M1DE19_SOLTU